jgi:hypothetical protein
MGCLPRGRSRGHALQGMPTVCLALRDGQSGPEGLHPRGRNPDRAELAATRSTGPMATASALPERTNHRPTRERQRRRRRYLPRGNAPGRGRRPRRSRLWHDRLWVLPAGRPAQSVPARRPWTPEAPSSQPARRSSRLGSPTTATGYIARLSPATALGLVSGRSGGASFVRGPPSEALLRHRLRRLGGGFWSWGIEPTELQLLDQVLQART